MCPLKEQARLEETYANLKPLSHDGSFAFHHNYKQRRSIASPGAEKSAPGFRKLSEFN